MNSISACVLSPPRWLLIAASLISFHLPPWLVYWCVCNRQAIMSCSVRGSWEPVCAITHIILSVICLSVCLSVRLSTHLPLSVCPSIRSSPPFSSPCRDVGLGGISSTHCCCIISWSLHSGSELSFIHMNYSSLHSSPVIIWLCPLNVHIPLSGNHCILRDPFPTQKPCESTCCLPYIRSCQRCSCKLISNIPTNEHPYWYSSFPRLDISSGRQIAMTYTLHRFTHRCLCLWVCVCSVVLCVSFFSVCSLLLFSSV